MRSLLRLPAMLALAAGLVAVPAAVSTAIAAANHVVISEYATRGPGGPYDEFMELYNPTSGAISLAGWKFQYSSASDAVKNVYATLPGNASIPAHGFYLIAPSAYTGIAAPDLLSAAWSTGMADAGGHARILDASSVEVDKVGWGTAVNPEGTPAPAMTVGTVSVERKALATSTADSLAAGGAHELLGNGQDTNNNSADFVVQTHGRNPQNTLSPLEPAFAAGGNGTGAVSVFPSVVFAGRSLDSLAFSFHQDSSYTITDLAIQVPTTWTWSHSTSSVVLGGPAFASAIPTVVGETLFVSLAALSPANGGWVILTGLTTPASKGGSIFTTRTAVAGGTLTQVALQPGVRVLELVPIVTIHVNDASGVCTSPYAVGSEATVSGIVTANLSDTRTDVYVQDGTAGIDLFNSSLGPITLAPGDSITVTGSILQFRGLTELQPDFTLLTRHATGRPVPAPLALTCADVNATFKVDFTEPNESRLVRLNGVTYNPATSTITDASGTTNVFIPSTYPPAPSVFDLVGILKQYKPGTPAPGPPYTADYEVTPRTPDDIIAHPGPIFLTKPYEDQIQPTSVRINWTTDVASSSIVYYGLTPALGDSVADVTAVTSHALTVPGLAPATVYYYSAASGDANGVNASPVAIFSTASPVQSSGQINVYFNHSVNTGLAWRTVAQGNVDPTTKLVPRINAARRSIDAAFYSLSGTAGNALATALINAKGRGVKVRVICEDDNKNGSGFTMITGAGIPLITDRFDPINNGAGLMHNKFMVLDGRGGAPESVWVWTGSWNPTDPGTNDDFQNSIEVQDQALAGAYTLEFNEMWGSSTDAPNASVSRFGADKLDDTPHRFVIGGRNVECYFSPSDGTNAHILTTLDAAQHSIGFELLTLTRTDLSAALVAQKNAGIKVRGDLDNSSDTGSQYAYLVANGVDVALKSGVSGLLHHKYCIVDAESPTWDAITLTGSHNWSSSAEASNNENTLIVHDPDVTNQYLQEFSARYYQFGGSDSIHTVSVEPIAGALPRVVSLAQNYPNPSFGLTHIEYAIPTARDVELKLYDIQGRELRTLVHARQIPGRYRVELSTRGAASGVYFYRLRAGSVVEQRKMLIVR